MCIVFYLGASHAKWTNHRRRWNSGNKNHNRVWRILTVKPHCLLKNSGYFGSCYRGCSYTALLFTFNLTVNAFPSLQSIVVSDATGGSFMVTLDLTTNGGSVQTSGEIAYNADATGGRTSVEGILEVRLVFLFEPSSILSRVMFIRCNESFLGVMMPGFVHVPHHSRGWHGRKVYLFTTSNNVCKAMNCLPVIMPLM